MIQSQGESSTPLDEVEAEYQFAALLAAVPDNELDQVIDVIVAIRRSYYH